MLVILELSQIFKNLRIFFFLFTFGELILEVKINTKILIEAYLLNYKKKIVLNEMRWK